MIFITRKATAKITKHGCGMHGDAYGLLIGNLDPVQIIAALPVASTQSEEAANERFAAITFADRPARRLAESRNMHLIGAYCCQQNDDMLSPLETLPADFPYQFLVTRSFWGRETIWLPQFYERVSKNKWRESGFCTLSQNPTSPLLNHRRIISELRTMWPPVIYDYKR